MDLECYDGKCVRITTVWGEIFEGVVSYDDKEYAFHEYGNIVSLEDVNGPYGHFSEKYGLLEMKCLLWGTDFMEEVFDSEDDEQILRMLDCMKDNFQSLMDRAVSGMAPWRSGISMSESDDDESEQGPVYLGELDKMLNTLVKYSGNDKVVKEAEGLLARLSAES